MANRGRDGIYEADDLSAEEGNNSKAKDETFRKIRAEGSRIMRSRKNKLGIVPFLNFHPIRILDIVPVYDSERKIASAQVILRSSDSSEAAVSIAEVVSGSSATAARSQSDRCVLQLRAIRTAAGKTIIAIVLREHDEYDVCKDSNIQESIQLWNPYASAPFFTITSFRNLAALTLLDSVQADGVLIIAGTTHGHIQVLNLDSNKRMILRQRAQGKNVLNCLAAVELNNDSSSKSSSAALLVIAGYSNAVTEIYDGRTGTVLHILEQHNRAVLAIDAIKMPHCNSAWICTGAQDGTALLWDACTGALLRRFSLLRSPVVAVGLVADSVGKGSRRQTVCWVCTGCANGATILWDAASGTVLRSFNSQSMELSSLAITISTAPEVTALEDGRNDDADEVKESRTRSIVSCDRMWLATATKSGLHKTYELTDLLQVSRWIRSLDQGVLAFPVIQSAATITTCRKQGAVDESQEVEEGGDSFKDNDNHGKDCHQKHREDGGDYLANALLRLLPELLNKPVTSAVRHRIESPAIVTLELAQVLEDDLQFGTTRILDIFQVLSHSSKVRRLGEEVASMRGLLPAMLKLPQAALDELVSTRLMLIIINSLMTTRRIMNILLVDGIAVTLSMTFYLYTSWYGQSNGPLDYDMIVFSFMLLIFAIYFAVKDIIVPAVAMYRLGVLQVWIQSPPVWVELFTSIALGLMFGALNGGTQHRTSDDFRIICAIAAVPIFAKVLLYIRVFNEKFSTFVISIYKIMYDLRFFVVVLGLTISCFATIMYLLLAPRTASEQDRLLNPSFPEFETVSSTFLTLYMIMVGDFDLEWFAAQPSLRIRRLAVFSFVCYIFVVSIVLLNILIALVSDSYENAIANSKCLYMRTRLEFLVRINALMPLPGRYVADHEAQLKEPTLLDIDWAPRMIAKYLSWLPMPLAAVLYALSTVLFLPVLLLLTIRRLVYIIYKRLLWPLRDRNLIDGAESTDKLDFDDDDDDDAIDGDAVAERGNAGVLSTADGTDIQWNVRLLDLERRFEEMMPEEASSIRSFKEQIYVASDETNNRIESHQKEIERRMDRIEASLKDLIEALR